MRRGSAAVLLAAALLCACSAPAPPITGEPMATAADTPQAVSGAPVTQDAATRTAPVVPGRPGRVFIFAGVGESCEQLPAPQITVTQPPQKGEITYRPGQTTTIAASKSGKCIGSQAQGTGVYYTARDGATGSDTFALTARMASGETLTRTFSVQIAP